MGSVAFGQYSGVDLQLSQGEGVVEVGEAAGQRRIEQVERVLGQGYVIGLVVGELGEDSQDADLTPGRDAAAVFEDEAQFGGRPQRGFLEVLVGGQGDGDGQRTEGAQEERQEWRDASVHAHSQLQGNPSWKREGGRARVVLVSGSRLGYRQLVLQYYRRVVDYQRASGRPPHKIKG